MQRSSGLAARDGGGGHKTAGVSIVIERSGIQKSAGMRFLSKQKRKYYEN
jgi:hypothetical protein